MNCHGNNSGENKKHNPIKHMLMMVFCCGLPFINIGSGFKSIIGGIAPFICPIMMALMMIMMFKGGKNEKCCSRNKEVDNNPKTIE